MGGISVKATNQYGSWTTFKMNGRGISLISISGINPPNANISTAEIATKDGSFFTNAQIQNRNIVLTFDFTGVKPETLRESIYYIFKIKEPVSLEITTGTRTATIDGYVESISVDPYAKRQRLQISIVCPEPYFLGDLITYTGIGSVNAVPLSDTNQGALFTVTLAAAASGLVVSNSATAESFYLTGEYSQNDVIEIDTRLGQKSVKKNGANILGDADLNLSKWIQLTPYDNNTITVSPNTAVIKVEFNTLYEGL